MERKYEMGQHVIYVDKLGKRRNALVNTWWMAKDVPAYQSPSGEPGCNLLFVTNDELKNDTYGSQIERETSVVHKSFQPAHGNYWCWPDEA